MKNNMYSTDYYEILKMKSFHIQAIEEKLKSHNQEILSMLIKYLPRFSEIHKLVFTDFVLLHEEWIACHRFNRDLLLGTENCAFSLNVPSNGDIYINVRDGNDFLKAKEIAYSTISAYGRYFYEEEDEQDAFIQNTSDEHLESITKDLKAFLPEDNLFVS
jgi:hypothetical protein